MAFVTVLTGVTAPNSAPTVVTDGVRLWKNQAYGEGLVRGTGRGVVKASATTSGSGSVTLKLWGWDPQTEDWLPFGTSTTDANKGLLNEETAIGETQTNKIQHSEIVLGLTAFTRVYAEITAATALSTLDVVLSSPMGEEY